MTHACNPWHNKKHILFLFDSSPHAPFTNRKAREPPSTNQIEATPPYLPQCGPKRYTLTTLIILLLVDIDEVDFGINMKLVLKTTKSSHSCFENVVLCSMGENKAKVQTMPILIIPIYIMKNGGSFLEVPKKE